MEHNCYRNRFNIKSEIAISNTHKIRRNDYFYILRAINYDYD